MVHDCFKCSHGYMAAPLSEWWCEILEKTRPSHDGQVWTDTRDGEMGDSKCWRTENHSRECDDFKEKTP